MTKSTTNSKSFIIHKDSLSVLKKLKDDQAGKLFKAIACYQENKILPDDELISIIFEPFLNQFTRDEEKYKITCERRREAGSIGGKQRVANASKCKQDLANLADSDSKNKNDSKNDSDSKNKNLKNKNIFKNPTLQEIIDYCNQKKFTTNPAKFFEYYEAGDWKDQKGNKVKNWKQKLITWENKSQSANNLPQNQTEIDQNASILNKIANDTLFKKMYRENEENGVVLAISGEAFSKATSLSSEMREAIKNKARELLQVKEIKLKS